MNAYQLLLFVHVLGAVGIFAAIAVEAVALGMLRRADVTSDARPWIGPLAIPSRLGPVAMGATLVSGMGMMAMVWGHPPWIVAAFVGLAGMAAVGGVSIRLLRRVRAALASETGSELSGAFRSVASADALTSSVRLRIAIAVAILALMSFKLDVAGSSLVLGAGTFAGLLASGFPHAMRRSRPAEASEP